MTEATDVQEPESTADSNIRNEEGDIRLMDDMRRTMTDVQDCQNNLLKKVEDLITRLDKDEKKPTEVVVVGNVNFKQELKQTDKKLNAMMNKIENRLERMQRKQEYHEGNLRRLNAKAQLTYKTT